MKEKVYLTRPNGEVEEKKLICHFKTMDEDVPHIKGIPILVVDRNENNNGNNVLEFYWAKDGVYQSIDDEAAWAEVKTVIIDVIKNNFEVVGEE